MTLFDDDDDDDDDLASRSIGAFSGGGALRGTSHRPPRVRRLVSVPLSTVVPAVRPLHQELGVAMRVCALPAPVPKSNPEDGGHGAANYYDDDGDMVSPGWHAGSVQRVEANRVRVRFDVKLPLAWRKVGGFAWVV